MELEVNFTTIAFGSGFGTGYSFISHGVPGPQFTIAFPFAICFLLLFCSALVHPGETPALHEPAFNARKRLARRVGPYPQGRISPNVRWEVQIPAQKTALVLGIKTSDWRFDTSRCKRFPYRLTTAPRRKQYQSATRLSTEFTATPIDETHVGCSKIRSRLHREEYEAATNRGGAAFMDEATKRAFIQAASKEPLAESDAHQPRGGGRGICGGCGSSVRVRGRHRMRRRHQDKIA